MITILLQKILEALTQLLFNLKTKLNTIKNNLDDLIVVNTATGPIASFTTTLTRPLLSCIVNIPTSVSGTDTVIVTQTGKNRGELSENNKVNVSPNASYTFENNGITVSASGTYARVAFGYKVETGKKYTVSFYGYGTGNFKNLYYNNAAEWGDSYGRTALTTTRTKYTKTITANSNILFVGFYDTSSGTTGDMNIEDFMIEEGETATTFEVYNATTKTVSLPSTVYGGNVDIIIGNITKTYDADDLGVLSWNYESDEGYFYSDSITDIKSGSENCLCESGYTYDAALSVDKTFTVSGTQIRFRDDTYSAAPDFKTAVSGIDFIYELAEADTDTITPEVITALNGVNNIFSDSGNVTVEYLKLYKEV